MSAFILQGEAEKKKGIRYQVDPSSEPIGEGGMGKVYQGVCVDVKTGATRPVAIKFMFDDLPAQAIERARREAAIQLRNDNLVEMLGFIELDEPRPDGGVVKHYHVASELLTGVSLADLLQGKTKDRLGKDVPFAIKLLQDYQKDPEHFAVTIVSNVLSGLLALHDAGYIHRDIDPSNIMLTEDEHIKLIDFGIAKQMNALTTNDKSLTVAGNFMGKPEYAAPELALGDIKHQNQTTDIYAVGILLYQCIVGHTPFEGARHEVLAKQLKEKLPLKPIKSKALKHIIATACDKKQELRYQTAAQMRVALENMNGIKRAMSAKQKGILGGVAAAVIAIILTIGFVVKHNQDMEKQKAEQALMEKQKAEFSATIKKGMADADKQLAAGIGKTSEKYDEDLIHAYERYTSLQQSIDTKKEYHLDMPAIADKQKQALQALKDALADLQTQVSTLSALGEAELAADCQKRADNIQAFLGKVKK